ncbi:MAG: NUDIX hydrolase [Candidatus Sumerlaeia bacterium]
MRGEKTDGLEVSSGGVLVRRRQGEVEVCLISTREGRRWQLPKGHLERGESPEMAAVREVREETGCEGRILGLIDSITYGFVARYGKRRPSLRHKRVYFYLMLYEEGRTSDHDWEVDASRWFRADEAREKLSFSNERQILHKALESLQAFESGQSPCRADRFDGD